MKLAAGLVLVPLLVQAQLQQLMPDGILSFDVRNQEILEALDNLHVQLPGVQKVEHIGTSGKTVKIEKYDRGAGYKIRIWIGWEIVYNCTILDRKREDETRYCY